jgi:hypothetical protein
MFHAMTCAADKRLAGHGMAVAARKPAWKSAAHNDAAHDPGNARLGNQALLRITEAARRPGRLGVVQRKCACGGEADVTGSCAECSEKRLNSSRRSRENVAAPAIFEADRVAPVAGHRCDIDGNCPEDEPANHRDFLGIAICNQTTGKVDPFVYKEHCKGDCVAQHEAQHVNDLGACCSRSARCVKNGADVNARNECRDQWVTYSDSMENFTECNAYTREDQCLTAQLNGCGFPDQDPDKEACCQDLVTQQTFARKQMKKYCPGVPVRCPFDP